MTPLRSNEIAHGSGPFSREGEGGTTPRIIRCQPPSEAGPAPRGESAAADSLEG